MRTKLRRLPPLKGGRIPSYNSSDSTVDREIERLSQKHRVTKNYVRQCLLAEVLGVDFEQIDFRELDSRPKLKRVG